MPQKGAGHQSFINTRVDALGINSASQDAGAEMTISSKAFPSQVLKDGQLRDIHSLGIARVPAGTVITFKMTSPSSAADTSLRITRLTVSAVPAGK